MGQALRGEYQQKDAVKLQAQANQFTNHYINRRWHMGLPDMMTPAQFKQYYEESPEAATLALAEVYGKSRLG